PTGPDFLSTLAQALNYALTINLILAWFNLLPVPPLDGSHVLYHMLPAALGARYRAWGRYGVTLLFFAVFLFPGAISLVLAPVELVRGWVLSMALG
ncbi:MAG: site-2 protease family protein, partial [Gemmatimonadota bacterium]|nr:site-2 protease family protein [Gemmatimonadota bacterium]